MNHFVRQTIGFFGKQLIPMTLTALLVLGITACGREPESDIDFDWVYVHEFLQTEGAPKQEVVLGTLGGVDNSYIVYFNRRSNDYRVTIRQYLEDYEHLEDALNRLNADIVSDNCPDLLYLNFYYMEVRHMASNGVFEDLAPFLERSSLDRSDMFESLLEDYTYNGKLICIPSTFGISTVIGSTDVVGEEMGWTMDDVIALTEAYPEAKLLGDRWSYRENLLWFLLDENSFVDWETGTCSFDSDAFKGLLEYVLDENGERELDELGYPRVVRKENANSTGNGTRLDRVPAQEDIDMIYELIQSAGEGTSDGTYRAQVIISEEVDAYFLGQKSVDEVADVIQSRMQVYVSENY